MNLIITPIAVFINRETAQPHLQALDQLMTEYCTIGGVSRSTATIDDQNVIKWDVKLDAAKVNQLSVDIHKVLAI